MVTNGYPHRKNETLFSIRILSGPAKSNVSYRVTGALAVCSPNFVISGKFSVPTQVRKGELTLASRDVELTYVKRNPTMITSDEFNYMMQEIMPTEKQKNILHSIKLPMHVDLFKKLKEFKEYKMDSDCSYFRFDYETSLGILFDMEDVKKLTGDQLVQVSECLEKNPWHAWFYKYMGGFGLKEAAYSAFHRYRLKYVTKPINPVNLRAFRLFSYMKKIRLKEGHEMFRVSELFQSYLSHHEWSRIAYENNDTLENLAPAFDFLTYQALTNSNYLPNAPIEYVSMSYDVMINREVIKCLKNMAKNDLDIGSSKNSGYTPCIPAHVLSEPQKKAVRHALTNRLTFLEGAPGTGKTEVLVAIMAELCTLGVNPMVVTFVGMMVDSLQKRFGNRPETANTIHYVCCTIDASEEGKAWASKFQVLIVDEGSNIDIKLFRWLLKCLPNLARLIIVGDLGQIYPIETGCPFFDLTYTFPQHSFMLYENKRVDPDSRNLADAAASIRRGEEIQVGGPLTNIPRSDDVIQNYVNQNVHSKEDCMKLEIVTLMNIHRRTLNTKMEEALIKKGLLRDKGSPYHFGVALRLGKKITFTENTPATEKSDAVKNGEIGQIERVVNGVLYFKVSSGLIKKVLLSEFGKNKIESGYAVTCNKSQGSEWDNVIYWIHADPFDFFTREFSYVAISRAKKKCTIVGEMAELNKMCKNKAKKRNSLLRYYLHLERIHEFERIERDDDQELTDKFKLLPIDVLAVPVPKKKKKEKTTKKGNTKSFSTKE